MNDLYLKIKKIFCRLKKLEDCCENGGGDTPSGDFMVKNDLNVVTSDWMVRNEIPTEFGPKTTSLRFDGYNKLLYEAMEGFSGGKVSMDTEKITFFGGTDNITYSMGKEGTIGLKSFGGSPHAWGIKYPILTAMDAYATVVLPYTGPYYKTLVISVDGVEPDANGNVDLLKALPGYDEGAMQVLMNMEGELSWVQFNPF